MFFLVSLTSTPALSQTLTHGPVTGGVDANDARIFVRTSAAATVAVQYSTDPGLATPQTSANYATSSIHDFTAIAQLSSLSPVTTYYLNVLVNGVPQLTAPYPSFTTFPVQGTRTNFKFVVLTDFQTWWQLTAPSSSSFTNAGAENPAFAFIGGDFDHSSPTTIAAHRSALQAMYNPVANSGGMSNFVNSILRKMPIAHQWDDHDTGQNNTDKTLLLWPQNYQVFNEYIPAYNYPGPPSSYGIWQYFNYGQVDFFILDCRSQRDMEYLVDDAGKSMLDGRHLGPDGELAWFENGLLNSTATWKVVFTSVPLNPTTKFQDSWAGYQYEWNRIRTFIQQNHIKNVFFISGDLHSGGIDDGAASGFPEMVVGGVNLVAPAGGNCASGVIGTWDKGTYPAVRTTIGSCPQYGVVTFGTNPDTATLQLKDSNGNQQLVYQMNAN
jgi:alkaline phosphatase D